MRPSCKDGIESGVLYHIVPPLQAVSGSGVTRDWLRSKITWPGKHVQYFYSVSLSAWFPQQALVPSMHGVETEAEEK